MEFKINRLYKYRSFGNFTDEIIKNSSLYFSPINKFNDPFDCKLSFRQEYTHEEIMSSLKEGEKIEDFVPRRNRVTDRLILEIGVLSLTKNSNNILMWSHYAKDHTGLVFEFNISKDTECFVRPHRVDYSDIYDELSYIGDGTVELPKLMLTKYKDWEYEKEYRIIDLHFYGAKKFNKDALVSVIFGAKANECNIQKFKMLCKDNGFGHIAFKKAKMIHGKFELEIEGMV